ncbi:PASTA domain-containing protein [Acidobacteriota bacterium]
MSNMFSIIKKFLVFSLKTGIILVGLALVIGLSTWITIHVLINREEVVVPDLVSKDLHQATVMLEKVGLKPSIMEGKEQYSDEIPFDHILKQDPPAGTTLKTDRKVKIFLSLGSGNLNVPDLANQATQKARIILQERGLTLNRIARIHTNLYPPNTIITQDPKPGEGNSGEKSVSILESLGPDTKYYLMPDFTYYNYEDVVDFFVRYNIRVRTEFRAYEGLRDNIIIKTKPHPGYPLRENDIVSIYVSRSSELPSERQSSPYYQRRRTNRGNL